MKCQVLIDWLTFSVKETDPNKVIQTYLGMDPDLFQDTGYSLMGYNKVLRFSDILVCSDGREDDYFKDMGILRRKSAGQIALSALGLACHTETACPPPI